METGIVKNKNPTVSSVMANNSITFTPADEKNTLLNPINPTTDNIALADLNQKYYPLIFIK